MGASLPTSTIKALAQGVAMLLQGQAQGLALPPRRSQGAAKGPPEALRRSPGVDVGPPGGPIFLVCWWVRSFIVELFWRLGLAPQAYLGTKLVLLLCLSCASD